MWKVVRQHPRAAVAAIVFHATVIIALMVSFTFTGNETVTLNKGKKIESIEAVAVDEKDIQKELDRIKQAERRKLEAKKRKQREAAEKKQRAAEAKKRKEREAAEKKRQAAEARKRKEREAAEKKQREAEEKKRLAAIAAQKQEAERKRKEEERLAELERKKREEADAKARQAEIARQEADMKAQREEDERQAQAQRQANQAKVDKYRALIKNEVTRKWRLPPGSSNELVCVVGVRLIPSGEVIDVKIIESSGDPNFDRSVEAAIKRAAPLQVPPVESGLFEEFRQFNFKFVPPRRG